MHCPSLPAPRQDLAPAFTDPAGARAWIATQPQAQPLHMLAALRQQIEAIDGAALPPAHAIELLNSLHKAALPLLAASEARYLRKALPMQLSDQQCFEHSVQLWLKLGIAYLRRAPLLSAEPALQLLQRAANAFRMAQYCHFQAAQECPPLLDHLLLEILTAASSTGVLLQSIVDPDFPHLGEANLAGIVAWAFLLKRAEPYQLSAPQLIVANRALRRWRELAAFLTAPDSSPRAENIDLGSLFDTPMTPETPCWLEIRKISRKIGQRIEALEAGDTPEALKLGRELSGTACIRLLRQLETSLHRKPDASPGESGDIALSFGCENAYAIFAGQALNPIATVTKSSAISHQRMAIFGFDTPSGLPGTAKKTEIPAESWTLLDGMAQRPGGRNGERRASPCLVSCERPEPRLGVMQALRQATDGSLKAKLQWHADAIEAGFLTLAEGSSARTAAFVLHGAPPSIVLPAGTSSRTGHTLAFTGKTVRQLLLGEVLERGIDFVRHAIA